MSENNTTNESGASGYPPQWGQIAIAGYLGQQAWLQEGWEEYDRQQQQTSTQQTRTQSADASNAAGQDGTSTQDNQSGTGTNGGQ
ncbi:uncharacterized protein I303_103983 [Kwoniella dejecticola CBS 10117]|uniref:Uncharacterized protein n=1 Tax=Kwoniella dejecticola CBS 10117 TaxID=1296121 RepID=A0A1A6A8A0_9TREE|nr:uncharacterized protein I303_04000 [Kwoniella dejecticola CBS 10117]OBR86278.1 hypothetical protein I303_04000 [Kwoniella dejecticola CBS 10117]